MALLYPTYFPSIVHMVAIVQSGDLQFEIEDNYQKQTYRNRTYIAHANGKLLLNVPIQHSKNGHRQKTKDVRVDNSFPWQSQHWKSLQSAYRTSPFFEFYEDDLEPLFSEKVEKLLDFNLKIFETLCELIQLETNYTLTTEYQKNPIIKDLRHLVLAKKEPSYPLTRYNQVLQEKHGFISNLSVLDLLFNEGPNTINYLETQNLVF